MRVEKCYELFPFLGQVVTIKKDERYFFIRYNETGKDYHAHSHGNINGNGIRHIQKRDVCLFRLGENKKTKKEQAVQWVHASEVNWKGSIPVSQQAYEKDRKRYLETLPVKIFADIIAAKWLNDNPSGHKEAWKAKLEEFKKNLDNTNDQQENPQKINDSGEVLDGIVIGHLQRLPIDSTNFSLLVRAIEISPYISLSIVIKPAIDWLNGKSQKGLEEALEVFSAKQLSAKRPPRFAFIEQVRNRQKDRLFEWAFRCQELDNGWLGYFFSHPNAVVSIVKSLIGDPGYRPTACFKELTNYLIDSQPRFHSQAVYELSFRKFLAVDLECRPKGNKSWDITEIGAVWAWNTQADSKKVVRDIQSLQKNLPDATLIIGHNILKFDIPILEKDGLDFSKVLVWDTMLVSFFLDPWKKSYALGGPHDALGDAKNTLKLFKEQVKRIGLLRVMDLLEVDSPDNLYRRLGHLHPKLNPPASPDGLGLEHWQYVTVPDGWMTQFFWRQGIAAGDSDGFLAPHSNHFERLIQSENPVAIVLGYVLKGAIKAGIVPHRDMIPLWMREDPDVDWFIQESMSNELRDQDGMQRVIPFSRLEEQLVPEIEGVYTADKLSSDYWIPPPVWESDKPENKDTWAIREPFCTAIHKRSDWRVFKRVPATHLDVKVLPEIDIMRKITRWGMPMLFPETCDVQEYWVEAIGRFLSVAAAEGVTGKVPILFVDAEGMENRTGEKDISLTGLVYEGLYQLGKTPSVKAYHARLRRLQIAQSDKKCLVAPISELHEWLQLSALFAIPILPVIERLPLENWLWLDRKQDKENVVDESVDEASERDSEQREEESAEAPSDVDNEPTSVKSKQYGNDLADLMRLAPQLTGQHLKGWLIDIAGPTAGSFDFWMIDPRVQVAQSAPVRDVSWRLNDQDKDTLRAAMYEIEPLERKEPSTDINDLTKFVGRQFYKNSDFNFYDYQEQPVAMILERAPDLSLLVRLPTGAGKSLIFQAPALFRGFDTKRLTLVISPLKALMKDQVESLREKDFGDAVDYLSSDRPWWESNQVIQGIMDHRICMLYVAPERLRSKAFVSALERRMERDEGLEYLVFDEAHCISQWGHEFRPDYLFAAHKIKEIRKYYSFPVLLFSATVPDTSKITIRNELGLAEKDLKLIPEHSPTPIRPEIDIHPYSVEGSVLDYKEEDWELEPRLDEIRKVISQTKAGSSVIVFVQRRAHAEIVAARLQDSLGTGKVDYFHAGLPSEERHDIYGRYKNCELQVLVATKAFGMGMDISHIHHAVHLSPPTYLEDYLQEVGRIGRDKRMMDDMQIKKLPAHLLFFDQDFETSRNMSMKSRLRFEDIDGFWNSIRQQPMVVGGMHVLLLPASGMPELPEKFQQGNDSSRGTKVRMALHWLEQADRVVIHRMLPSIIYVQIHPKKIRSLADDREADPEVRDVACALRSLIGEGVSQYEHMGEDSAGQARVPSDKSGGFLDNMIDGIASLIGFVFGGSASKIYRSSDEIRTSFTSSQDKGQDTVLELDALGKSTGLSPDDVLGALWKLASPKKKAIKIKTSITFSCGKLPKSGGKQYGDTLLKWLLKNRKNAFTLLARNHNKLLDWENVGIYFLPSPDKKIEGQWQKIQERALLKIMRLAGGHLERAFNDEGNQTWKIKLNKPTDKVFQRCENIVKLAKNIWGKIGKDVVKALGQGELQVQLSKLMACTENPRRRDLEQALDLLATLGLIRTRETLLPMAYFLELKQPDAPLEQEPIKAEINQINDMAELRGWAMESFCYISSQSREQFIEGYFAQGSPDKLRKFLMNILDEESKLEWVNDETRGSLIRLRNYIDHEYVEQQFEGEVFGKHRGYDEQWQAITMPKDKHVLVNAGPGSGKTAVLIARIVHLIQNQDVHPHEIMVLAFNRAVVHEIRTRIRDIFDKVGYGGYVRSLRIYTFHGLAAQHVDRSNPIEAEKLLSIFAGQLIPAKAGEVAGGIKTILVDEFQDMNEDLREILTAIQKVGNAHIFAIGDDDQDILSWLRKSGPRCSTVFFKQFSEQFEPESLALTKNFRSSPEIVERSQNMIKLCSKEIGFTRRKEGKSLTSERSDTEADSPVNAQKVKAPSSDDVVSRLKSEIETSDLQDIAILCRTNAEVAWWHENLQDDFKDTCMIIVQGSANYDVGRLRHVVCWLDCVERILQKDGDKRLEDVVWRDLSEKWQKLNIPEAISSIDHTDPNLKMLWNFCRDEKPYAKLSDLKEFVSGLKLDEYEYLLRRQESVRKEHGGKKRLVFSTIHKVKGLEFDHVVIVPSGVEFPYLPKSNIQINQYAAEEARLYYVAMTRAKNRLTFFFGPRERAWLQKKKQPCDHNQQSHSVYLEGSLGDFYISWAARKSNNGDNRQLLIENEIRIGEKVKLNGSQIERKEFCIIGWLRGNHKDGKLPPKPGQGKLEVVAIIRYDQTDENYRNKWCTTVQKRDPPWSWLVCMKGFYEPQ